MRQLFQFPLLVNALNVFCFFPISLTRMRLTTTWKKIAMTTMRAWKVIATTTTKVWKVITTTRMPKNIATTKIWKVTATTKEWKVIATISPQTLVWSLASAPSLETAQFVSQWFVFGCDVASL